MRFARSQRFDKRFRKLPALVKRQVEERLRLFASDPLHPLLNDHALHGEHQSRRSINVTGDIRIVYEMFDKDIAKLIDIGTHSELYNS